jgi:hypothetical protein
MAIEFDDFVLAFLSKDLIFQVRWSKPDMLSRAYL